MNVIQTQNSERRFSALTAVWAIAANMIGTGIFTSLSYQIADFNDYFVILCLWLVGGIISLCGAYAYSNLAIAMPDAVGEYDYLSRLVHPSVGFVSSWISITVGFAAPIALILKTMEAYLRPYVGAFDISPVLLVLIILLMVTTIHTVSYHTSDRFHGVVTVFKVVLLIVFTCLGFLSGGITGVSFTPTSSSLDLISSSMFATSLVYVLYTYSGWNASTYLARELPDPKRTLPRSILLGTISVSALYILINAMFLYTTPTDLLRVETATMEPKDLAVVVAHQILPSTFSSLVGAIVVVLLMSSMSAMVMVGPRVAAAVGDTNRHLRFLATRTKHGIPALSIVIQSSVSAVLYLTNAFEQILMFTTMILTLSTMATVISSLRVNHGVRSILSILIFTVSNVYVLYHIASHNSSSIVWTISIIVAGLLVHRIVR